MSENSRWASGRRADRLACAGALIALLGLLTVLAAVFSAFEFGSVTVVVSVAASAGAALILSGLAMFSAGNRTLDRIYGRRS